MTKIPGNTNCRFGRIYSDTTKVALEAHLRKVIDGQQASMRGNAAYKTEVNRLRYAIATRRPDTEKSN